MSSSELTAANKGKIATDFNQHNAGQPLRPSFDSHGKQNSKLATDCRLEYGRSLECIQENYDNKGACQPFYDNYKACRSDERARRLAENAKKSFFG